MAEVEALATLLGGAAEGDMSASSVTSEDDAADASGVDAAVRSLLTFIFATPFMTFSRCFLLFRWSSCAFLDAKTFLRYQSTVSISFQPIPCNGDPSNSPASRAFEFLSSTSGWGSTSTSSRRRCNSRELLPSFCDFLIKDLPGDGWKFSDFALCVVPMEVGRVVSPLSCRARES